MAPQPSPPRCSKRLRPSGGYRTTCSFQTATVIYDATYWFCEKFLDSRSRTVDQMIQAARSGRQNIAEGSRCAATSSQTELRLVNTAGASLEELLLDYEDYLRHRHLVQWEPDSPEAVITDGGYSEQLAAARLVERERRKNDPGGQSNPSDHIPSCPRCSKAMVLRTAKTGKNSGQQFWGCSAYPECKVVVNL